MAGRKPKPSHLKLINGNPGKRPINKREPTASSDLPIAPKWLNDRAREIFAEIVALIDEMGYASRSHMHSLALAASRLEEVEVCTQMIDDEGRTYETTNTQGDTSIKSHPAVAQRSEAMRHAQSLLAEFGLTPSAAAKVVVPKKQPKNRFSGL